MVKKGICFPIIRSNPHPDNGKQYTEGQGSDVTNSLKN